MPWYTLYDLQAEITAAVRVASRAVDVLHYIDPEHGMQFLPILLGHLPRRIRPRIVATFHQPADLLARIMRPDVVACLDHATVVSPDQASYLREILPPERISVVLHGIDSTFFRPGPRRTTGGRWTCLTVGHNLRDFTVVRGVADLLRGDRDVHFEVIALQAEELAGLPNVTVRSGLSDDELVRAYQSADVLLLPLNAATANNALLEAFGCGLPVVTSDLPGIRAYAPAGESILIDRNDPRLFAEAVWRVRNDHQLAASLGAASRRRAEELDWSRIAREYERMYLALAHNETLQTLA